MLRVTSNRSSQLLFWTPQCKYMLIPMKIILVNVNSKSVPLLLAGSDSRRRCFSTGFHPEQLAVQVFEGCVTSEAKVPFAIPFPAVTGWAAIIGMMRSGLSRSRKRRSGGHKSPAHNVTLLPVNSECPDPSAVRSPVLPFNVDSVAGPVSATWSPTWQW